MSKLRSPFIVEFYGVAYMNSFVFVVMELCSFGTMPHFLKTEVPKLIKKKTILKEDMNRLLLLCCLDAARGVKYLHHHKVFLFFFFTFHLTICFSSDYPSRYQTRQPPRCFSIIRNSNCTSQDFRLWNVSLDFERRETRSHERNWNTSIHGS